MAAPSDEFEIFELDLGTSYTIVEAAARTICLAFSNDPLIQWLRPMTKPWDGLEQKVMDWQIRRIKQNLVDGRVFAMRRLREESNDGEDPVLPAVAFLVEPVNIQHTLSRIMPRLYLWLAGLFMPLSEGSDEKRFADMMHMHESMLASMRKRYQQELNYIEIVAVDPKFQGFKLGSRIFGHVLSVCRPNLPVVLEATSCRSVPFYERFGFKLIETGRLTAKSASAKDLDETTLWFMSKA